MISDTDFTNSPAVHLLNGWFIVIYFAYSEFKKKKINTKTDDKVAVNKAEQKGLNIKKEILSVLKNILYLWQRNDQIYCSGSGETDNIA